MSIFISLEGVPVSVDGDDVPADQRNTIYIKEKMDVGAQNRMLSALAQIREEVGNKAGTSYDIGAFNLAMLKTNILRWEGPAFQSVPCTPENIERLDPEDPLVAAVMEALNERNVSRNLGKSEGKSPNSAKPAGKRVSQGAAAGK